MPLILPPEQREAWLNDPTNAARMLEEGTREMVYEPAI
jgi:putative SOS response-associated peptidase YedK